MNKNIIFYSPLGNRLAPDKIGGTECASRKTIGILTDSGFRIILLRKPVLGKWTALYLVKIFLTWLNLLRLLIIHQKASLHVVGVYRGLMYVEWVFIVTAKILSHKTVYDIRNGDMIKEYENRNQLYKWGMLSLLKHSDSILCQGIDYVRFIEQKLGKPASYYPNYLRDRFMTGGYPQRDMKGCRLVYFGRIVPAKNIEIILDICKVLYDRGMSLTLDLIGGCSDTYKTELEDRIREVGLSGNDVRFWGNKEFDIFFPYLQTSHFFLFPSDEPREGHSNSLTEAMGCGIVPVVSDIGFNRQVVDADELVVPDTNISSYADIVYKIWTTGQWENYSRRMYSRVAENFTESRVKESLLAAYR